MARRRSRILKNSRTTTVDINTLDVNEIYSVVFYLFELAKKSKNDDVISENFYYDMVFQMSKKAGLYVRFNEVLEAYINHFLAQQKLNYPDDDEIDEKIKDPCRADSMKRYMKELTFQEDLHLSRYYSFDDFDTTEKNFFRILYVGENGLLTNILYYTFFSKAKVNFTKKITEAPVKYFKIAKDISKVKFIQREVNLTDSEAGYLLIRYRKAVIDNLSEIMYGLSNNSTELYTKLLSIDKKEFGKIVRSDGKLCQYGFITNEERELNSSIIECIENQDFSLYFSDCIKPIELKDSYDLSSFSVPEENTKIYKDILKSDSPVSILFYGKPGSGKTEYSKALVKASGKKALVFKNESEVDNKNDTLGRLNCLLSLKRSDTVLIVDEADSLLETIKMTFLGPIQSSVSKGLVNKMLELSCNKVIWIVNHKSQMDESTLRRFTLSYKFEAMSPSLLEKIAVSKLSNLNLEESVKAQILKMFSCYKVTGSSVDNIVKVIKSMSKTDDETLLRNVEIVLKENSMLLHGKSKMRENVNFAYDSSVLNTSIPADRILRMLENAKRYADKNPGTGAVRMLFYGLSGTGKTEFARYISQVLGKKILLKRASDIFDKYVGGTEENIASAFNEAAVNDQILLFDEADSFFAERSSAKNNYERTQVNEFLTQLEEFPGIVICTTNLRSIMDQAMLRRFHITVEFNSLREDGIRTCLKKYFSDYSFDNNLVRELVSYESVTPGDFGRLADTFRFLDPEEVSAEIIVKELCNIQQEKTEGYSSAKSRKIGFVE